jgi:hypothetical protein
MDHFVPVSRGGKTEVGNLIPCCKSCNSKKNNRDPGEWITERWGNEAYQSILVFLNATREAYAEQ